MGLRWTVLEDTTLSGALLGSLRALWDPESPQTTPWSCLLGQVDRTTAVLAAEVGGDTEIATAIETETETETETADSRTVGAAVAGFSSTERVAVLDYVFVAGRSRGQGFGRQLVDRMLAELTPHADIVFADAEEVSEAFLRSMGWRLLPHGSGLGWLARSRRLTVFPDTPAGVPARLAVKILRPMDVEKTVTLAPTSTTRDDHRWTHAIVAAMMRGDLDLRDLGESLSREVHASLATRRTN